VAGGNRTSRPEIETSPDAAPADVAALSTIQREYFSFLIREFPTLCLSDEFIFFPRLSEAAANWFRLPELGAASLEAAAARLTALLARLDRLGPWARPSTPDEDAILLRQSLISVRRELGPQGPWLRDPFFYLKVASLAWAPVLSRTPLIDWQDREKLAELLRRTSRLLRRGRQQVQGLSPAGALLAPLVFADAHRFLTEAVPDFLRAHFPEGDFAALLGEIARNLRLFEERVATLPAAPPAHRGGEVLAEILTSGWGWGLDLDAAHRILEAELAESKAQLERLAQGMRPGLTWEAALSEGEPPPEPVDILGLYRRELHRLWNFWQASPVLPPLSGRVEVAETPLYLRSLRTSASYAAPWGAPEENPGYFYVTPEIEDLDYHFKHHRFLSAHETVPGHHLLDAARLHLASPLRRQYESPLFYEGWACYAEVLAVREGYLAEPRELLVGWQRRFWRALRGLADLDYQRGRLDLEQGLDLLRQARYPEAATRLQMLHLTLTPGYQLCYTLGLREVLGLRERFGAALGPARFHRVLLSGGQLPFDRVAWRLEEACRSL
jgi:hypothetical protein